MERDPIGENLICWLCDNGLLLLAFFVLGIIALFRWDAVSTLSDLPFHNTATPKPMSTPLSSITPITTTAIPFITTVPPTATITIPPTSTPISMPEFVMVFVSLSWQSDRDEFERLAQQQANTFIDESGIDDYFIVEVVLLETGLDDVDLGSEDLVTDLVEFGLEQAPGDRYIGLTDGDIAPNGISDVVGWTSGGVGVVGEASDAYVITHELGHAFGLCDEYNYQEWFRQNEEYPDGCPNPYPSDCPQTLTEGVTCNGSPASDGSNSIMGPAGLLGGYSFNSISLTHLQQEFQELAELSTP